MIKIEIDDSDLQRLMALAQDVPGLEALRKISGLRITGDGSIALDIILRDKSPALKAAVELKLSRASDSALYADLCRIGLSPKYLPDTVISGGNKIASWFNTDITALLEKLCGEFIARESPSRITVDISGILQKKMNAADIRIHRISLDGQKISLETELC